MKKNNNLNNAAIFIGPVLLFIFILRVTSAEKGVDGGWAAMAIMFSFGPFVLIALAISLIAFIYRLVKEKKNIPLNLFVLSLLIAFMLFILKFILG